MKKRINIQFIAVAITAIFLTLILAVTAFYQAFEKEIFDNLKTYVAGIKSTGEFDDPQKCDYQSDSEIRLTLIDKKGVVLYDSGIDITKLNNHYNRPEVKHALKDGAGRAVRKSSSAKINTYYYAVKLDNGNVLRAAKKSGSVWGILSDLIFYIMCIAVFMIACCMVLAHLLTKSLITPIEHMAEQIDDTENVHVYKEMAPFVTMIRKQHEDIMKNAKMRQEFTANVSHELKTPLTSISGYSELIENGMATDQDVIRFAREIHKNSNRLLTLINDIIRLSELDVMDQTVEMEALDMYTIADNCVNMLGVNAENHGVTIQLHGRKSMIMANKEMMEELVYNLCDNAIRYNKKGGRVDVTVDMYESGNELRPYLAVKDTGIGISKQHQERIFERFYRVDKSRSKSTGGTGLGLAIVKHILVQHNAIMELESEKGEGTEIKVIFTK